ncbi:MAG TPA: type III polyketide synthase [Blastocatellia bacterium]|nr:type III polyketide synthase [Blastocatellia bacterium]
MRQAHLQAIGTAVPRYRAAQVDVAVWAKRVAASKAAASGGDERSSRRIEATIDRVYRNSAIHNRASVVPDYVADPSEFTFYPPNWRLEPSPTTAERMGTYRREAPPLAITAVNRCLAGAPGVRSSDITHLIVVTCTGFFAPGIDTLLVKQFGLRADVQRLQIGFMGCYAAFNALRTATSICQAESNAVVLVVCVELCSIHFQNEYSMNNVVANCLFSDGAAATLVTSEVEGSQSGLFEILGSHTVIAEDTDDQMTWTVTDTGFQMSLTAEVPETLRNAIAPFVDGLLAPHRLTPVDIGFWAVHPGGRRIVEAVRESLELPEDAVAASFDVLSEHGNMSSPTVLFVLERCVAKGIRTGDAGVALAFGPGLTLESLLLRSLS